MWHKYFSWDWITTDLIFILQLWCLHYNVTLSHSELFAKMKIKIRWLTVIMLCTHKYKWPDDDKLNFHICSSYGSHTLWRQVLTFISVNPLFFEIDRVILCNSENCGVNLSIVVSLQPGDTAQASPSVHEALSFIVNMD